MPIVEPLQMTNSQLMLVFGLSFATYLVLTVIITLHVFRLQTARPVWLVRWTSVMAWLSLAAITVHIVLVWAWRFDWRMEVAMRNGPGGFLVFVAAYLGLLWALPRMSRRQPPLTLLIAAYMLVTAGAVVAPFRYPEIGVLAIPMAATALVGLIAVGFWLGSVWRERNAKRDSAT